MAVTGSEDVAFDVAAAETLESQCRSAARQVENLHSSRTGWVATAKTDFSGYFSTVFSDNADIETTDASNLAACLRGVADAVRFLIDPAGGRLDFSYDEAGRPTPTVGTDADGEVVLRSRESWRGAPCAPRARTAPMRSTSTGWGARWRTGATGGPCRPGPGALGASCLERTGPGAERMSVARDEDAGMVSLDGTAFGRVMLTRDRAGRQGLRPGRGGLPDPRPAHPRAHRAVDGQPVLLRGQQPAVILRSSGPQAPERRRPAGLHRRPHRLGPRGPVDLRQQLHHRRPPPGTPPTAKWPSPGCWVWRGKWPVPHGRPDSDGMG